MFWLASFPRSGNTFFRNLLYEVYGLDSVSYDSVEIEKLKAKIKKKKIIKTHLLPSQLITEKKIKSVELVRDARDALVSIAHHRSDIIAPGSDFRQNLIEAIKAEKGSFFGGWSKNVEDWYEVADVVLRFEDFIQNPLHEAEKINLIQRLPRPKKNKIPSFEKLKNGNLKYGTKKTLSDEENVRWRKKFFRKGKVAGWKEELPNDLHDMIWEYHGKTMEKMGYTYTGEILNVSLKGSQYERGFFRRTFYPI